MRIALVGLSDVGISMGLALKNARLKSTEVVGFDLDGPSSSAAKRIGAVDEVERSLQAAVLGSQIVIVSVPTRQMSEALTAIGRASDLDTVITDTNPVKAPVLRWAEELLPSHVHFVGGHPITVEGEPARGEPSAAMFAGGSYAIVPAKTAAEDAVQAVVGIAEVVGAKPYFVDAVEHDSYELAGGFLPILASAAVVDALADHPAWQDIGRFTGDGFRQMVAMAETDAQAVAEAYMVGPELMLPWLDRLTARLHAVRDEMAAIAERGGDPVDTIASAQKARRRQLSEPNATAARMERPSLSSFLFGEWITRRTGR